jgi:hypothetical protein
MMKLRHIRAHPEVMQEGRTFFMNIEEAMG